MSKLLLLALAGYTATLAATHTHDPSTTVLHFDVHPPAASANSCRVVSHARLPERSPPKLVLRCDDPAEVARIRTALGPPTYDCVNHCSWGHGIHMDITPSSTTIELR